MPLLTTGARDRGALLEAFSGERKRAVVCLCAAWCDTCEEFRQTFARLAEADAEAAYVWIDIEDDSDVLGDLDIENFPTLAVFRGDQPLFYGVTLPQQAVVSRTIAAVSSAKDLRPTVPEALVRLPAALRARSR